MNDCWDGTIDCDDDRDYDDGKHLPVGCVRCCDCDGSGWWQYDDEWLSRQRCGTCGGAGEVKTEDEDEA